MKKKLLIISPVLPLPLNNGGAIAQFFFIQELQHIFSITFCTVVKDKSEKEQVEKLKKQFPLVQFLFEDAGPELTIWNRLRLFKKKLVNFWRYSEWNYSEMNGDDFAGGYFTAPPEPFPSSFITLVNNEIGRSQTDIVQVDFYDMLPLLAFVPASVKKLAVIHELHTVRLQETAPFSSVSQLQKEKIINVNKKQELDYLSAADDFIVFHQQDQLILKQWNLHASISPYSIPEQLIAKKTACKHFSHFLFTGSQSHGPNEKGLEWFLDTVYIPLRSVLKKKVIVTGRWQLAFREKYQKNHEVQFTGEIHDPAIFFDGAILIVPTAVSTGLRTKILHAFANKVPVISTPAAAVGCLGEIENDHILIFSSREEFLSHFGTTDSIDEQMSIVAERGYQFWNKNYNTQKLLEVRTRAILS